MVVNDQDVLSDDEWAFLKEEPFLKAEKCRNMANWEDTKCRRTFARNLHLPLDEHRALGVPVLKFNSLARQSATFQRTAAIVLKKIGVQPFPSLDTLLEIAAREPFDAEHPVGTNRDAALLYINAHLGTLFTISQMEDHQKVARVLSKLGESWRVVGDFDKAQEAWKEWRVVAQTSTLGPLP